MDIHNGRPGDVRNFIHKRIIGAVGGFIGGGPLGAVGGFLGGGRKPQFPVQTFAPTSAMCPPGFGMNANGQCVPLQGRPKTGIVEFFRRKIPGGETGLEEFGEAVMGQFGAALQPAQIPSSRLRCPRGSVLGTDELCYNRRDLKNDERKWPRGTRPLLTGGDMRCIRIASAAAKKLQRKEKQLQAMGMLKKASSRRRQAALPAAHHAHVSHD